MEIAVLLDGKQETSGFEKNGTIFIYEKSNGEWTVKRQKEYCISDVSDAYEFHQKIREICTFLDTCKVIIVNRIRGIHYLAFEEFQISMLEVNGNPKEFLDDIVGCMKHKRTEVVVPLEPNTIFERQPGHFDIDLRSVMNGKTSYTSKQILLPFLKNESFQVLEILCDHVPKWLEKEQEALKIHITVESYKDCLKVKIFQGRKKEVK